MSGAFIVQHTIQHYSKDKRGQGRSYISRYRLGAITLDAPFGWACDVITISAYDYVTGYVTTARKIAQTQSVVVFVERGSLLLNKQSNEVDTLPANVDVFGNYVVFKNDVTIGAYTSSGLTEVVIPGDKLLLFYPVNEVPGINTISIEITADRYSNGYVPLPLSNLEYVFAYVYRGTHLLYGVEYDIVDDNFIFRNGVTLGSYTSSGLIERLQEGDIVTLIMQQVV